MSSDALYQRALRVMPGGNSRSTVFVAPHPPYARRGAGWRLWDADGNELIDFQCNYASLVHGHAFAPAMQAAAAALAEGSAFGLPTAAEVELAERLATRMPWAERWRFAGSGTEAVMMAVRAARAATGRDGLLRFADCYHGSWDAVVQPGAPGVTGAAQRDVLTLPVGDAEAFAAAIDAHGERLACVLLDLMPNRAGLRPADPEFVELVRERTSAHGIVLILDEIITFRAAPAGMQSLYGVEGDLVVLGKVIGGGLPIGAIGGRAAVMDVFDPRRPRAVAHGGTFSANPVSLRAGAASLDALDARAIDHIDALGDRLRAGLRARGYEVTGRGSLLKLHVPGQPQLWWRLYRAGVLTAGGGLVCVSTPMDEAVIDRALVAFEEAGPTAAASSSPGASLPSALAPSAVPSRATPPPPLLPIPMHKTPSHDAAPSDPVILAAVRTPVGRYGGALAGVRPDDLAAITLRAAVERVPELDPAQIEEVYLGCANQAGEDNRNVARMALLLAGLPQEIPGVTVNRLCASGLSAVVCACQAIRAGDIELAIAGGVESMSRAPLVMGKDEKPFARGDRTIYDTTIGWRFPNPRMQELFPLESMGETGENVAERWGVSRADQDAFALESQRRWAAADAAGRFAEELVAVGDCVRDEHPRPQSTPEALAKLRTVFREGGTVTAGNSSGVNDGAAALVIASAATAQRLGVQPLARFVGSAAAGVDPRVMGIGPVPAVRKLLARAGVEVGEIDLVELNEAFASQSLAVIRELGLDPERVNVNGGAIAIGHPLGMSGARLVVSLAHELRRREARLGLATLCVGVGQGQAALFERVH